MAMALTSAMPAVAHKRAYAVRLASVVPLILMLWEKG